jgi:hypothetical protein
MNYGAIAVFGVPIILMTTILFTSTRRVFAGDYEKSQVISQGNGCGNYWFPVNLICSNLNSQVLGDENNVVIATTLDSDTNFGAPFQ